MARESKAARKERAAEICARLAKAHPDATIALKFGNNWELLVATILSAQATDVKVNEVTADLFKKYRTVEDYASADLAEFEQDIHALGFFRNKAKSITGAARELLDRFGGEVPRTMEELLTLPGVARKTANVVLGNGFGIAEGFVVDTHVARLSVRMGLTPVQKTKTINTDQIERDLMELIPREKWIDCGHALIFHGRRICDAKKPLCGECPIADICPKVGVKSK
ncbi:MAG: endonuclease III [Armatimonadetes bacterium]|nr:endonuclease III [Armatimonadota bacterium]MDI9585520.1 endonuclease III [Acidobacteriota bacterium]